MTGTARLPVEMVDAAGEQRWNEAALAQPVRLATGRLWRYAGPAIVLGRSQHALRAAMAPVGLPVVERRAGGGAVLVGPWLLGASIVLPTSHPLVDGVAIPDSYRWLGGCFVRALARHGVASRSVPATESWKAPADLAWACYAGMSPWEVAVDRRKLVGFAQRRARHGILLVAGALLEPVPWGSLAAALRRPADEAARLADATASASAIAGAGFDPAAFARDLGGELAAALGAHPVVG